MLEALMDAARVSAPTAVCLYHICDGLLAICVFLKAIR